MTNFEKETSKAYSQRQLKKRWDTLKKEWKAWKKLKGRDTDDWWESKLEVVPEAQKFRTSSIDLEFEGKLDQMFRGIVATGDKAWAPSSKSSKQIEGVAKLSSQIEKLCNATENMNQATSILTPIMDPYDIPQAIKVLNSMSEEVPEASLLYFFSPKLLLNKDKRIMLLSINPKIRALWLKAKMEDS
uniref:Myb/SANT-like domain-containing protein n=1 Tax=Gossypium raimondii TaxID=29730 RepID=A0A0D2VDK4_GOSRA|nr:hypothetical protein B456_013G110200 [Gossypium raimondii]